MHTKTTAIYTIVHFFVDFCCAFLVLSWGRNTLHWLEALLIYNFCAFAVQMPLGLLVDRFGNGRMFSAAGCFIVAASSLLRGAPMALCVLAGLGNALFHIGGGRDVLLISNGRSGMLGVFVSTGAFGLFLGKIVSEAAAPWYLALVIMLLCAVVILLGCPGLKAQEVRLDGGGMTVLFLLLLFLVVVLRSWGGFLFSFTWKTGIWLWLSTLSVVFGKALGGFVKDYLGLRAAAFSLIPAAALFLLSGWAVPGCLALLLFNMTMPLTLRLAADLLPDAKGFSFGLLTFALFLGFLPTVLGMHLPGEDRLYAPVCILSLLLLLPFLAGDNK